VRSHRPPSSRGIAPPLLTLSRETSDAVLSITHDLPCPELVALGECLEAHEDNSNFLCLTYIESSLCTLQAIHKWIGCGLT
jgi:hypothetical protein